MLACQFTTTVSLHSIHPACTNSIFFGMHAVAIVNELYGEDELSNEADMRMGGCKNTCHFSPLQFFQISKITGCIFPFMDSTTHNQVPSYASVLCDVWVEEEERVRGYIIESEMQALKSLFGAWPVIAD